MHAAGKQADILRGSFRVLRDRASLVHILVHFALRSDSPSATSESTSIFTFSPSSLDS